MTQYKHISGLVWPIKISVVQVTGRGCFLPGCIQWSPRTPFTDLSERGELANRRHTQCQAEWTHYWPYSWCATSSRLWFQSKLVKVTLGGWLVFPEVKSEVWLLTCHNLHCQDFLKGSAASKLNNFFWVGREDVRAVSVAQLWRASLYSVHYWFNTVFSFVSPLLSSYSSYVHFTVLHGMQLCKNLLGKGNAYTYCS